MPQNLLHRSFPRWQFHRLRGICRMLMNFSDSTSIRKPENTAVLDALQLRLGETATTPSRPIND
jgi:hypothetical protein